MSLVLLCTDPVAKNSKKEDGRVLDSYPQIPAQSYKWYKEIRNYVPIAQNERHIGRSSLRGKIKALCLINKHSLGYLNIFKGNGSKVKIIKKKNLWTFWQSILHSSFIISLSHIFVWSVWFRIQNKCKTVHSNIEFMQIPKIINIVNMRSNMRVHKRSTTHWQAIQSVSSLV